MTGAALASKLRRCAPEPSPRCSSHSSPSACCPAAETPKEDKAKAEVCSARDDIAKQVDDLKSLTITTASISQIKDGVTAIGNDLKKIASAQSDLSDERKQQVQDANSAFKSSVDQIASSLGSSTSLQDAATQLVSAGKTLAQSYENTFAKVDCG